jgi:hypothetical protein
MQTTTAKGNHNMPYSINDLGFDQFHKAFVRLIENASFDKKLHALFCAMQNSDGATWYNGPEDSQKIVTDLYRNMLVLRTQNKLVGPKHLISSGFLTLTAENIGYELRLSLDFNTNLSIGYSEHNGTSLIQI